eukprot:scaffold578_cov167-Amphora_coffeaeformis.AAC.42
MERQLAAVRRVSQLPRRCTAGNNPRGIQSFLIINMLSRVHPPPLFIMMQYNWVGQKELRGGSKA